ncbi:PREDICTED: transcription factor LHW-like [Nicotiana attenuata]|uniref:Transcription factor bhlh155 n=1 Tax=Nicotiana attenuata TaxID=49451 RepID=A0A314KPX2_NICAT|nr:PREDICTED: transcription factor LHW-like [Nicotiana attenuata]OIT31235.1 transcription factor bhlh155 [Nicotiana attenuata]
MEEQLSSLAVTHLLQHSLRSLCIHENSQWVYAVFWRILPRNYPPPKWDSQGGAYDRSRGNRRNWILVWEDGFCNFAASTAEMNECEGSSTNNYGEYQGLQPDLFFKMSHEIYNYGEGIIGKVAADHSHKWIYKEPNEQEINFLSAWHNSADSHPRTWEAQFRSGIKTIALIAVREGVIQLGAVHKVIEDLSYVVLLRKKFSYIESIPGVLLPHPSSSAYPFKMDGYGAPPDAWHLQANLAVAATPAPAEFYEHLNHQQHMKITPSMSSLEALLSKLPSVVPADAAGMTGSIPTYCEYQPQYRPSVEMLGLEKVAKEEYDEEEDNNDEEKSRNNNNNNEKLDHHGGESSSSMSSYSHHHHHYNHQQHFGYHPDLNVSSSMPNNGY